MKQLLRAFTVGALALITAACSGGGGDATTPDTGGPLTLALFAASPSQGSSPLRSTLTATITGGTAPYYYAWDFENDGAFDNYNNATFDKTISVSNDYFFNSADAGGVSTYQAVLRVTDSKNTVINSDPVTVLVQGTQDFLVDPDTAVTFPYSNTQNPDGSYAFKSSQPVFFQATVRGGVAPFNFLWDFDNDGTVDSSIVVEDYTDLVSGSATNVRQYTYTYAQVGAKPFVNHLEVVDGNGDRAMYDFIVVVSGEVNVGPPPPQFDIILNTFPAPTNGVVTIKFDPTGANQALPLEPELALSVVVNPDPSLGGVPPYEYYWDFESDGAIDSQAPSPTIPYYSSAIKKTINPYLIAEDEKNFSLTVMVIDSSGQVQKEIQSIRIIRASSRPPGVISAVPTVNADGNNHPYAEVANSTTRTDVDFSFSITGSTGIYQWQMDVDGDGNPDAVGNPPTAGFVDVASNDTDPATPEVLNITVPFGPYDNDANPGTPDAADWPNPGYWPVQVTIRSLISQGGAQDDATVINVPVSLVEVSEVVADGNLNKRTDHGMAAFWSAGQNSGGNGQNLMSREVVIVGGSQGTNELKVEDRITQTFSVPGLPGQREGITGSVISSRVPANVARRGQWTFNDGTNIYMVGGYNTANGTIAGSERHAFNDNAGTLGWLTTTAELTADEYFPLRDSLACNILNATCGGLVKKSALETAFVSGKVLIYDPGQTAGPLDDAVVDLGKDMITPRYDGVSVIVGSSPGLGADSRVYAIGGRVASGQSVATVEYLDVSNADPSQWFWVTAPSMLTPRAGCTAQNINGLIYVYGGAQFPDDESQKTLVITAEVFNPATGVWSYTLPPSQATYAAASVAMPGPGSVSGNNPDEVTLNTLWYFGGEGGSGAETSFLEEFRYFFTVAP